LQDLVEGRVVSPFGLFQRVALNQHRHVQSLKTPQCGKKETAKEVG
jgi:hypothetical protein